MDRVFLIDVFLLLRYNLKDENVSDQTLILHATLH
jgi:hypothetical protein